MLFFAILQKSMGKMECHKDRC